MLMAYSHTIAQSDFMLTMLRDAYHPAVRWGVTRGLLTLDGVRIKMSESGFRYWVRVTECNASRCSYPTYLHKVYQELGIDKQQRIKNGTPVSAPPLSDHKSGDNDL